MQVQFAQNSPSRTVFPFLFHDEAEVLRSFLAKASKDKVLKEGPSLLDDTYLSRSVSSRLQTWRSDIAAGEFDTFCLCNMEAWVNVARTCGVTPFEARPSDAVWTPPHGADQAGIASLAIPVLQILNDMIASATHPAAFSWELFMAVHDCTMAGYAKQFIRTSGSPDLSGVRRCALNRAQTRNLGRDLCNFGSEHLLPLWRAVQTSFQRFRSEVLHVVTTLPVRETPTLNIVIDGYQENVSVFYPNTVDKPGDLCLFSIPCRFLKVTRKPTQSSGRWRSPLVHPDQVIMTRDWSEVCFDSSDSPSDLTPATYVLSLT